MTSETRRTSPWQLTRGEWGVAAFTLAYMGVALLAAMRDGSVEFLVYLVVMAVLLALVVFVHRRIALPMAALWGLAIWGLVHMAGGLMPVPESWPIGGETHVLYNLWLIPDRLRFDQVVHAYGFGLVTWICWLGLRRAFAAHGIAVVPSIGLLTLCVAGGMGFGALNEVVEFLATRLLPETNVGGYENTGWDLVSNLVGSLVVSGAIQILSRSRRTAGG